MPWRSDFRTKQNSSELASHLQCEEDNEEK